VPLTNYLGWFLTVYIFYQIFAIYLRKNTVKQQLNKLFLLNPVILYLLTGLSFILMYFYVQPGTYIDAMGQLWDRRNIYETSAIVSLFTMVFVAFLSFVALNQNTNRE
jgi:uncharacterized membrane protein